jgi:hypothetical protein
MDSRIEEQVDEIERKVAAIYVSVEKTRKYMQITAWVTLAVIVLPLLGLLFAIPAMVQSINDAAALLQLY